MKRSRKIKKLLKYLRRNIRARKYSLQTFFHRKQTVTDGKEYKCLYVSPVGSKGKDFLGKIIEKFGNDRFDYLIFSYDGTRFDEPVFGKCRVIHEKGLRWDFMKKYVTPAYCEKYDYLFAWADDIDIGDFSVENYLDIVIRNGLQLSQPALTADSFYSHAITLRDESCRVGRFTDFVEIMVPVFERRAWTEYWNMLKSDSNGWGWGHDLFAKAMCGYKRMGIIDAEPVFHTRPLRATDSTTMAKFKNYVQNNAATYSISLKLSYGKLA